MGVYIKGMVMPKSCWRCPLCLTVDPDTYRCMPTGREFASTFDAIDHIVLPCPLVEIHQHGRLIDADELTERLDGIWDCNDMVFEDDGICRRINADCNSCRWRETRDYIKDHVIKHAPTIIDAERQ